MGASKQVKNECARAVQSRVGGRVVGRAPIVLVGFMGCGKSTLGRELARRAGLRFVDLDVAIEREAGLSVSEIFRLRGELGFRRLETRVLKRVLKPGVVLAAGGGLVTRVENRRLLAWGGVARGRRVGVSKGKRVGTVGGRVGVAARVVWIDPSWKVIWARLVASEVVVGKGVPSGVRGGARNGVRPLLVDAATGKLRSERSVRALWSSRRRAYGSVADLRVVVRAGERVGESVLRVLVGLEG